MDNLFADDIVINIVINIHYDKGKAYSADDLESD